ncbi:hypothetical protein H6761_03130 [Candidatus Nomurabacteria bacterium]|nr:hypothetical protein [Candidatus Nomurabacteria bacterium]
MKLFKNLQNFSDMVMFTIIGGIIGSILILGGFIWLKMSSQHNDTYSSNVPQVISKSEHLKLVSDYCYYGDCLFQNEEENNNYVFGLTTLKGWHFTRDSIGMGGDNVTCDAFVIEEGPRPLVNFYRDIIESGNNFYNIDENGYFTININLNNLSDDERALILNSDSYHPIEMMIFQNPPLGKGEAACMSTVRILEIEKATPTWQTYRDAKNTYEFEYPSEWRVTEYASENISISMDVVGDTVLFMKGVSIFPLSQNSVNVLLDEWQVKKQDSNQGMVIFDYLENENISGQEVLVRKFRNQDNQHGGTDYLFPFKKLLLEIPDLIEKDGASEEYTNTVHDRFWKTFKFLD